MIMLHPCNSQLVTFDRNEEITLYVTFDLNLSAHIGHPGARHAFEAATARTGALERSRGRQRNDHLLGRTRTIAVTPDQRSPLREVIPESFIDVQHGTWVPLEVQLLQWEGKAV